MIGKVYLVGAGPGDPELLTVKALRILRQADLVLHDDLVPLPIVALASADAQVLNVGKRCGKQSATQTEINAHMVSGARQGLAVVRLKGGDPSIFGRSGEEIEALRDAEVDFEVVPGVTAASAAAAAAGISLTHRDVASSVVFLTGHRSSGQNGTGRTTLDFPRGSLAGRTLVIYMPGPDYRSLQQRLQAAGVSAETPCLLISGASTGAGRTYRTAVEKLAEVVPLPAPHILIVGDVTRLAREAHLARGWRPEIQEWQRLSQ